MALNPGAGLPGWVLAAGGIVQALILAGLVPLALRHARRLEMLTLRDSLTELPNRAGLHAEYPAIAATAAEHEEIALALIDLDGFMSVNDRHGHAIGDRAICEAAAILADLCGEEARIYRLGGDEFALLKAGPLAATLIEGMARKIVERLSKPIAVDGVRLAIGASIGLARTCASDELSSAEMLRRADVAMYASKRGGKARCTWFDTQSDICREETRIMDEELRSALAREQFRLHYQPLVDCDTQRIVGVEALLRWNRPDNVPVETSKFVAVAEQSGLIDPLGLWVLRRACVDALDWDGITLSVNLSPAQLKNPEFPIQLGHILEETGFAPERLELEITENCLVLNPVVAERCLSVIRGFGVRVVLDDFGTGYASIGFLRQFRFEKLKIDRSLVTQADTDDGSRAMMLSSITVARAMKMDVTAEGVETLQQAEMVRAAGCDQIQGWLYFKAMPAEAIPQYLDRVAQVAIPAASAMPAEANDMPESRVA
ncbi:MAG: bifunctional diguanylate cyclase/phosphodiesterase [Erythrobacter sp.]|nr:bifunctional diguanylate cyclase/phosphodiesterase [Erythrobacter sp.]